MDYIEAKVRIEALNSQLDFLTKTMEIEMRRLERGSKLQYDRPPDFGRRRFELQITPDDFNVEEMDHIMESVKSMMGKYREIRVELSKLRNFLAVEDAVQKSTYDKSATDLNFGGR